MLNSNLQIILLTFSFSIILNIIYNLIKNRGKVFLNISKIKVNILNKDSWSQSDTISDNTKSIEISFLLQLYNHKKNANSIYDLVIKMKDEKKKYQEIQNCSLNILDTMKSVSGTKTYEKLHYVNLQPFEIKEYNIVIILTKEEFIELKTNSLYIMYKNGRKKRKKKILIKNL